MDIEELNLRLQRLVSAVNSATEEIDSLQEDIDAEDSAAQDGHEEFARTARRGEAGREWQIIQRRIDRGETTLEGVFSGADDSREAHILKQLAEKNLSRTAEEWTDEIANATSERPAKNPLAEFTQMVEQQQRVFDEIMDVLGEDDSRGNRD
ncbi:hypothetical protein [Mycetocola saprophilus]|uniref:hypothetical protein n=1 Tax=Mycetocola saprophilus TaxID=76636 RepID=UPI003BF1F690